jgi:CTP:molybdopterin cytidylyltransferase MocA
MIAAVILAAGAGRRLGTVAKAMLPIDGETFLGRVARLAWQAGAVSQLVVVAEPHRAETEREAMRLGLAVAINPTPERGMGSSVGVGFAAAIERFASAPAALLWPVDHIRVLPSTVRELCARVSVNGVVIPTARGHGGHPVLVGRKLWPDLACAGDLPHGARSVFRANVECVRRLEVDDPGIHADVDEPADLP